MSHATGQVIKDDAIIAYYEYNGTVDVAQPKLYLTKEEVSANWRTYPDAECTCGKASEDVLLYTSYGAGYYWPGRVCMSCLAITDGRTPDYDTPGHPLGAWNWPYDGDGNMLPEGVSYTDEPTQKGKV
jgi:hypothetical protein